MISPLLANIYLHYAFDLWVQAWRKNHARGDVIVVRYADDTVLGFQAQTEADRFLEDLRERLRKFGLELHPEKTRRIEFGRYAESNRKRRGEGKPETFDFLGFTHISGKSRKGYFTVKRHTAGKRLRKKLRELKQQLRARRHDPVALTGKWLRSVVQGYFNYHAVPDNLDRLWTFRIAVDLAVANPTAATQPTPRHHLAPNGTTGQSLAARPAHAAPLARSALRRYPSELRAVCANERTYGSVRGVLGNQHPYRDRPQMSSLSEDHRLPASTKSAPAPRLFGVRAGDHD